MLTTEHRFAELLSQALVTIKARKRGQKLSQLQDDIGYALGRNGGTAIEYWRKGNIPANPQDIEKLALELVKRGGFDHAKEVEQFFHSTGYPLPTHFLNQLFPHSLHPHTPAIHHNALPLSPFIVGRPIIHPRQFFGRYDELSTIFDLWRHYPLQNVAIIGPNQSGKTSLLHHLKTIPYTPPHELRPNQRVDWLPQPQQYQWVLVDFHDATMHDLTHLLQHILTSLKLSFVTPCDLPQFIQIMRQQLHTPTIIMFDELSTGLMASQLNSNFWCSLRSLSSTNSQLAFVITTTQPLFELVHPHNQCTPFFNTFGHTITLGSLTENEACELIATSPYPILPADIIWILAQSQGWPVILQLLSQIWLRAYQKNLPTTIWRAQAIESLKHYPHLLNRSQEIKH